MTVTRYEQSDHGARELVVNGIVQGVGFRPFVYRLASEEGLTGEVSNAADGVHIVLFGKRSAIDRLQARLRNEAPPLARIDTIAERGMSGPVPDEFTIGTSAAGEVRTAATPDAGLCDFCRREMFDPADRRFAYPFLNCTQCGPRFSIISALPYDRANTAMHAFPMCEPCAAEYRDVTDRRFHAQPTACADCGPAIWLENSQREKLAGGPNAIALLQERLRNGSICAIKGIGGFHLACSALDAGALTLLRERKHRPSKPFAVMVRDLDIAEAYCSLDEAERDLLVSPATPIVLADLRTDAELPDGLAPGLDRLGIMLPYSPLHALLLAAFDYPLVMTSGNAGDDPQITDNEQARNELSGFADVLLMHDRDIVNRVDDSLIQITGDRVQMLRRARGYAPRPLPLPPGFGSDHPQALALGGDIKNAFAIAKAGNAVLSQHIGDLGSARTMTDLEDTIGLYRELYGLVPELIAADAHPGYRSRRVAEDMAQAVDVPCEPVLHHHAHAASCMVENGLALDHPPVLALVQDGFGMGEEGALWGAELLRCDYRQARRLATLAPAPLLGGDLAAREPWRNLAARLNQAYAKPTEWGGAFASRLAGKPVETLFAAARLGVNSPLCSSAGRLFDAVAATVGLNVEQQGYEGEAAMRLQAAAEKWLGHRAEPQGFTFECNRSNNGFITIDPVQLWPEIAAVLDCSGEHGEIAARFHIGWAEAWCTVVETVGTTRERTKVLLSGGVFQNRLLAALVRARLTSAGFTVLEHSEVPANDGGLALGQIAIALAREAAA